MSFLPECEICIKFCLFVSDSVEQWDLSSQANNAEIMAVGVSPGVGVVVVTVSGKGVITLSHKVSAQWIENDTRCDCLLAFPVVVSEICLEGVHFRKIFRNSSVFCKTFTADVGLLQ